MSETNNINDDTQSQESFEKRLWNQTTVEDYLKQMVGTTNLDSSDDEESENLSFSIRSWNDINIDEVASLVGYLQELMEAAALDDDCDLSTLPDALREGWKLDDEASLVSLQRNGMSSKTLEMILRNRRFADDNHTVDEMIREEEREEESYLNKILGRVPADSKSLPTGRTPTKTIRREVNKTFRDGLDSKSLATNSLPSKGNNSLEGNATIDKIVTYMRGLSDATVRSDPGPLRIKYASSDKNSIGNHNVTGGTDNIFVSDNDSLGSISEDIEVIVANHQRRLDQEMGDIQNMRGEKDTMVSSLSFDATYYAKARAQLGANGPTEVPAPQSEVSMEEGTSEGWWVRAEGLPSSKTPTPQSSIGKDTPDTPSTAYYGGNILGLEAAPNENRKSVMKRAIDRYGPFIVWMMIGALVTMVLCVIIAFAAFVKIGKSANGARPNPIMPDDVGIFPNTDLTSMDWPPSTTFPPFEWIDGDDETKELTPITDPPMGNNEESTPIPDLSTIGVDAEEDVEGLPVEAPDSEASEADNEMKELTDRPINNNEESTNIPDQSTIGVDAKEGVEGLPMEVPDSQASEANFVENATDLDAEQILEQSPSEVETSESQILEIDSAQFAFFLDRLRNTLSSELPKSLEKLEDPLSPQFRAWEWIKSNPPKVLDLKSRPLLQKYALLVLYFSTNGENWFFNNGWLTDSDECEWYNTAGRGNICDELGRVTDIDLRFNNLNGSLPSELVLLKEHITKIRVNGNELQGTIPSFIGEMSNLERFHGHYNKFSGTIPTNLGQLARLGTLKFKNNEIKGMIPWQLRDLQNLETLDFEGNNLTGALPFFLGDLTSLSELNLANNKLSGTIPFELMNLQNLINLTLEKNNLTGSMPVEVCNQLTSLALVTVDCEEVFCRCCEGCDYIDD